MPRLITAIKIWFTFTLVTPMMSADAERDICRERASHLASADI